MPTIALLLASKRPAFLTALFENLRETVAQPDDVEVLVKADVEDPETVATLERERDGNPFRIVAHVTPRGGGYFALNRAYDALIAQASPDTYFFNVINDELRFRTPGWDRIVAARKTMFLDDIFFLRLSSNRIRNYYSLYDCTWAPENYCFYSRRWLELVGGWGDFWGVDSWQQCIAYHLGRVPNGSCPPEMIKLGMGRGHIRGIPVEGIELGAEEAMVNLTPEERADRNTRALRAFAGLATHSAQENFCRLAQRINAHLWAAPLGIPGFWLDDDWRRKAVVVRDNTGHRVRRFRFRQSRYRIWAENGLRRWDNLKARMFLGLRAYAMRRRGIGV